MTVAAATSLAAETNQRPSREVRSSTPLLRTGLHSVRAHHTEPRKTCSRVRGICNSAIMKREFVQPCAGQNSEFTSPPSPKKRVAVRQEQEKKKKLKKKKKEEERERGKKKEKKNKEKRKEKKKRTRNQQKYTESSKSKSANHYHQT